MANTSIKAAFERMWQHTTAAIDDVVQVSDTEPTDTNAEIWINTSEEWNDNLPEQVQADLNQTDTTAPDYVKGTVDHTRLPEGYPYKEKSVLFEGKDIAFTFNSEQNAGLSDDALPVSEIVIGQKYTVVWDGVEYSDLVAFDDGGYAVIGAAYGGTNAYMPFCMFIEGDGLLIHTYSDAATHSVSISTEVIKRIDPSFMPEGYPHVVESVVFEWDGDKTGLTAGPMTNMNFKFYGPFEVAGLTGESLAGLLVRNTLNSYHYVVPGLESIISNDDVYFVGNNTFTVLFAGNSMEPAMVLVGEEDVGSQLQIPAFSSDGTTKTTNCTFNAAGLWVMCYSGQGIANQIVALERHPIDYKCLPDTVPVIKKAAVGQIIRVASTDIYGVPTSWEVAYMPQADYLDDVTAVPTAEDFNALLAALRSAGLMKP